MAKADDNKDTADQGEQTNASEEEGSARSRGRARGRAAGPSEEGDGGSETAQESASAGDTARGLSSPGDPVPPNDWVAATNRSIEDGQVGQPSAQPTGASSVTGQQTSPGQNLRPGDIGYAPPARVAPETGKVLSHQDLGWTGGTDASVNVHGQVPLAMPAPAPATATSASEYMKPSLVSKAGVEAVVSKMLGDTKLYVADIPHQLDGENGVYVQFVRDLTARGAALATAHALGRTVEPDSVDQAQSSPPSEFFKLRHMAAQMEAAMQIYDQAMTSAGVQLPSEDKQKVEGIKAEFGQFAQGPKSPDDVVKDDEDPTTPGLAQRAKSQPQVEAA